MSDLKRAIQFKLSDIRSKLTSIRQAEVELLEEIYSEFRNILEEESEFEYFHNGNYLWIKGVKEGPITVYELLNLYDGVNRVTVEEIKNKLKNDSIKEKYYKK